MTQKTKFTYLTLSVSVVASSLLLAGCSSSGSSASSSASTVVKDSGGAVSKAMTTISSSAPQVKTSNVITSNWDFIKMEGNRFAGLLLPKAYASTSSLSATWGSSGAEPTSSLQVTLPNNFFGGDGNGVTSFNMDTFTLVGTANASSGSTYSTNGATFTVTSDVVSGSSLMATSPFGSNSPTPSGALGNVSGAGDGTINYSAVTQDYLFTCDNTAAYCPSPGTHYIINESLVDYVGQAMNSSFKNTNGASDTIFGRLNAALSIGCTLGTLITDLDTDGLPTVGVHTVHFPASLSDKVYQPANAGGCGMDTRQADQSMPITFAAVSGSSQYTKSMSLNVGNDITIYLKLDLDAGVFNFMQIESAIGTGRYAGDRTVLHMTGLNVPNGSKIAFEYLATGSNCQAGNASGNSIGNCGSEDGTGSGTAVNSSYDGMSWNSGFEFHRGFIDQANDVAYLLSSNGSPGKSDGTVDPSHVAQRAMFTAAGKPNEISACTAGSCSQSIAVSFGFIGELGGTETNSVGEAEDTVNTTDYNGCVTVNSMQVTDDSTLATCGVTGTNASDAAAMLDAVRNQYSVDVLTSLINGTTKNTPFPFTDGSDIYTAHLDF